MRFAISVNPVIFPASRSFTVVAALVVAVLLAASPATAATHRVPSDYTLIQDAIDASSPGDTVLISDGTYAGTGNTNLNFNGIDIVLRSKNGASLTTIDCADTTRGISLTGGETSAAVIEGIHFYRGNATNGGGMVIAGASPTVRECMFTFCSATTHGAGVVVESGSPVFDGCTFADNDAGGSGGGVAVNGGTPDFDACVFVDNTAVSNGGGFYSSATTTVVLDRCLIAGNVAGEGGGAAAIAGSLDLYSCEIKGNTATNSGLFDGAGGILFDSGGYFNVRDCVVSGNDAPAGFGGGISVYGATGVVLDSSTVAGNHALVGGGVFARSAGFTNVSSSGSILWDNCADSNGQDGYLENVGTVWFGGCVVDPSRVTAISTSPSYDSCINADPLFCGPLSCPLGLPSIGGDYTLEANSPAFISAGIFIGCLPPACAATPTGTSVLVQPPDPATASMPVSITFDNVTTAGVTTLTVSDSASQVPGGFSGGDPTLHEYITTTAGYSDSIEVCVAYDASRYPDESDMRLLHYDTSLDPSGWVDITASVDTVQNVVCGKTDHLSAFVVARYYDVTAITGNPPQPGLLTLHQNVPNPFNPATTIRFETAADGHVELRVYDVAGRLIRTLVRGTLPAAQHTAVWDGRDQRGQQVATGVYFYRLVSGRNVTTKKMMLLK